MTEQEIRYEPATIHTLSHVESLLCKLYGHADQDEIINETNQLFSDGNNMFYLAFEHGDNAVAVAHVSLRRDYVEGTGSSPVGYLEAVYVLPEFRLQGVGGRLVGLCEEWAKSKGCREFAGDCALDNTASYKFHLSVGFTEANRVICFVKRG